MLSKISSVLVIILLIILIVLNCWFNKKNEELTNIKFMNLKNEMEKERGNNENNKRIQELLNNREIIRNYDKRILTDPFKDPKNRAENNVIADLNIYKNFNQSTQGALNDFHVVGVLNLSNRKNNKKELGPYKMSEFVNNATIYNNILQLYGRQKYRQGKEYEYYTTITSGNQTIKIPIFNKNKQELYDGDEIFIKELNKFYIVSKYPTEEIEYIPL